ncbi:MAG: hypothetical protein FWF55_09220 [Treponema sp.]|nr:hypothetical protein [Treponema sp.]
MEKFEDRNFENEIIEIARISAESFYYKSNAPNVGNYYVGKNEVEGQCSDYALKFVLLWNEKHPENPAEIVTVNQPCYIKSGSYKVVKKITSADIDLPSWWKLDTSQWIANREIDGVECSVLFHPEIGFYQLVQSEIYEIKQHFGFDMANKGQHVWAKIGDIAVDPCWADTDNTPFIGKDVIIRIP